MESFDFGAPPPPLSPGFVALDLCCWNHCLCAMEKRWDCMHTLSEALIALNQRDGNGLANFLPGIRMLRLIQPSLTGLRQAPNRLCTIKSSISWRVYSLLDSQGEWKLHYYRTYGAVHIDTVAKFFNDIHKDTPLLPAFKVCRPFNISAPRKRVPFWCRQDQMSRVHVDGAKPQLIRLSLVES